MDAFVKPEQSFFKKLLMTYLASFLAFAPLSAYGGPLQADGSTQTIIDSARNSVPVVHIANPNASGLSYNRFIHYNVNREGLILNNATTTTVNTQLGGYIYGNSQLQKSAKVILNEVTSTNRSSLNGYTEVAGPRTDLVIANPNGITINGAGFINTSNVTLTTGRPIMNNGALDSLNITGGDISIQGDGLNTQNQDSTRIYTQYLQLNAKIHARNLDIKLGNNSINYRSRAITASSNSGATGVLLDSSALGGMYANRITLVGTDQGLGVNMPPEVLASTGDIIITNDGTISLQKITASQQINVQATDDIQLGDNLYSGTDVTLDAGNAVSVNNGVIAAKNSVTVSAAQLTNQSTMLAGLNEDGTLNNSAQMNISAGAITNSGQIQSTGNINATTSGTTTNNGIINAGNDLTLTSNSLTNNATLFAGNDMNLYTTGVLSNTANANIFAVNNLTMAADNNNAKTAEIYNFQASIQAYNGNLSMYANRLDNDATAPTIETTYSKNGNVETWDEYFATIYPAARLESGANMDLNVDMINNQYSLISAGGNISITANTLNNLSIEAIQTKIEPVTKVRWVDYDYWKWPKIRHKLIPQYYTVNETTNSVLDTLFSTIQAGGSISGNVSNLNSGGISQNQIINATAQLQDASTFQTITLPTGTQGLFVVSGNPQGQYLIETNPEFAMYNNFISSDYMMQRINFSPDRTLKRVGDAFYENKLIRDSIFAQTGRRFLNSGLTSDKAQYQYLMDSALKAQQELQLVPGIALSSAQIAMLYQDIVWLEEQVVAGEKVLVPVVYIANVSDYSVEGGKIIAGDDIDLLVTQLENSGLMEAGKSLAVKAAGGIINRGGSMQAGGDLALLAKNDIENISASIKGKNIILTSTDGNIINSRDSKELVYRGSNYRDAGTLVGEAGNIEATDSLTLNAGRTIAVTGSRLKAKAMRLNAAQVEISTTVKKADYFGGGAGNYIKDQSTTNIASNIDATNLNINSSGTTLIKGSNVNAKESLNINAGRIDILAVNDSSYVEDKSSSKSFLSKKSTTSKKAISTNIASNVSGGTLSLTTTGTLESSSAGADIGIIGSNVSAKNQLALNSAGDINVQAGFDGGLDESYTKKSGWFTGGALFSKSESLQGKLTKTAAVATVSGSSIALNANGNIALSGVDLSAQESLTGSAQNISVENVFNEEKRYSKESKLSVSLGDALKSITNPFKAVKVKDGKASITLAKAEFSKADKTTITTEVVSSNLEADNITLTAGSDDQGEYDIDHSGEKNTGNINIKGSNLIAKNDVNLTAGKDVSIIEAKSTEKSSSKEQEGTAELKLSVKNEYVQIGFAVKAAKQAKDNLQKSKRDYTQYKRDLSSQQGKLASLKADLKRGKIGIEQGDVDEMASLIDDLKGGDAFYKANIALAAADLASKTVAVASQMATAASSSGTYGFSAALELDIDTLEQQFEAYKEQSVASNISGENINISAGETATVQGSNLNATNRIDINAKDTNILASTDVNTTANSSERKNLNISIGMYGGAGNSISVGADRSKGSSRGITNQNSELIASNININTNETTTIAGANIKATDNLNISTKNLNIASVQDSSKSRSQSQGFSISGSESGVSGVGINAGNSRSREKQTVLTALSGNRVNIDTQERTTLRGASIVATDADGNDNGNLSLKTDALEVSSLNNTRNSKSMSLGINAGISNQQQRDRANNESTLSTVGIDFANDKVNSKTKTLGTIGEGSIEVANVDESNTKMLNRDINNNEIDIYDIESKRGLRGSLDTRLLTKKGRTEIVVVQ